MKKLNLFSMLVAVVALLFASCSINMEYPTSGEERVVTLSAHVPSSVSSRAAVIPGNAAEVKKMSYWVYRVEGSTWTYLPDLSGVADMVQTAARFRLYLLKGVDYQVVLWADAFGGTNSPYNYNPETYELTMDFSKITANSEKFDAFFGSTSITASEDVQYTNLYRPFAQLNIGTTDLEGITANGAELTQTGIELECASVLNLKTGEVSGEKSCTYALAAPPTGYQFPYESGDHDYLSLSYILVGSAKETRDITLNYYVDTESKTLSISSVPLQRNCRTNVYGGVLFGEPTTLNPIIEVNFETSDFNHSSGYYPPETEEEIPEV